jgi:hypothetical protein
MAHMRAQSVIFSSMYHGNTDRNLACIEVKLARRQVAESTADLLKLTWFSHPANYHRGLFLV